jgi:hypothetical protein
MIDLFGERFVLLKNVTDANVNHLDEQSLALV